MTAILSASDYCVSFNCYSHQYRIAFERLLLFVALLVIIIFYRVTENYVMMQPLYPLIEMLNTLYSTIL